MLRTSAAILAIIGIFSCENTWMKNLLTVKGDGTAGNPFRVYNKKTLQHVGNPDSDTYSEWTLNAHYIQTQNIDMAGEAPQAIGDNSDKFTGSYNGNGKTIRNFEISKPTEQYQGLFGYIDGATVKNIRLVNCQIEGGTNTGSIVGYNDGGLIQNCSAAGSVTGTSNNLGGIVGNLNSGTVQNCYFTGSVDGNSTNDNIGGVIGSNNSGTVQNCYTTGNVIGRASIGGVVGNNDNSGIVQNCYATGSVNGNSVIGGIAGSSSGTVRNCVALNTSITGTTNIGRVVGYGNTVNLSNNYAFEDLPTGSGSWPIYDGANVSLIEYHSDTWWKTESYWNTTSPAFAWDFVKVWRWDSGIKLPVLRN